MPYFGESPLERIVDVHWKKKDEPEPPDPCDGPTYCGHYGAGFKYVTIVPPDSPERPDGPHQYPPTVGTFWTLQANIGDDGTDYGAVDRTTLDGPDPPPTLTVPAHVELPSFIVLEETDILFTTDQLQFMPDDAGGTRNLFWRVPMVQGCNSDRHPLVVKLYHINVEWHHFGPGFGGVNYEQGLGFEHPIFGRFSKPPTEPYINYGVLADGDVTYAYDFHSETWRGSINDVGYRHDPSIGGPVLLWWFYRLPGSTIWTRSATRRLAMPPYPHVDDYVHFHITAECGAV